MASWVNRIEVINLSLHDDRDKNESYKTSEINVLENLDMIQQQ